MMVTRTNPSYELEAFKVKMAEAYKEKMKERIDEELENESYSNAEEVVENIENDDNLRDLNVLDDVIRELGFSAEVENHNNYTIKLKKY